MQKTLILSAAILSVIGTTPAVAQQQEGNWMVRVRAVNVQTDDKSDPVGFGAAIPSGGLTLGDKTIPEVDISYFFSKNLAAELILTYPQRFDVNVSNSAVGPFKAGTIKALPPTLTLQYHFMPDAQFRPYVGVGVNYTRISSINLSPLDTVTSILTAPANSSNTVDKNSWGGALQAGFDVKVGSNGYINFDVKKVYL